MGVELLSCWSFELSSTFWILLDLKYLSFPPFFLSSLLTLWDALFSLIMKNGRVWHHRRSNSTWNSLCRCILQGCNIPDSFSMFSLQVFALFRVSRITLGCPLSFCQWAPKCSILCSVLPHKCVARGQRHHSFCLILCYRDPRYSPS